MNVIFLDFEGTIITHHGSKEDIEKKVKILSEICKGLDCKVVIESVYKESIDEETMETISDFVKYVFALFNKYGIKCVGRTPSVDRNITDYFVLPNWK